MRKTIYTETLSLEIYLRENSIPILLDFGAASQALGNHSRSITGILTSGYAPYEQYSSKMKFSPALDLYALGATLYQCITTELPPSAPDRNVRGDKLQSESSKIRLALKWLLASVKQNRLAWAVFFLFILPYLVILGYAFATQRASFLRHVSYGSFLTI